VNHPLFHRLGAGIAKVKKVKEMAQKRHGRSQTGNLSKMIVQ
jgi:hypothetical protein